jgi:tight adherence protein B
MIPGLLLLAVALLALPPPAGVRRARRIESPAAARMPPRLRAAHGRCVAVAVCGASILLGPGPFLATLAAATTMLGMLRRRRADRARARARQDLLDGLDAIIAELRVGANPVAAAGIAARECRGDAARAFACCAGHGRLGGVAASGLRLPGSVIAAELDRVAHAWSVAEQRGVALADLLAAARTDLLGRMRFHARTHAALAGARASAAVLAALPALGIALGQLMGAAPLRLLFGGGLGGALLALGVGLVCAGLWWTELLVRRVVTA